MNPLIYIKVMRSFLLLIAAFCCVLSVNAQRDFTIGEGYFFPHVRENTLDKRMAYKGKYMDGLVWKDESGENTIFLTYDANEKESKRDIYVYQYRIVGDKCSLVWDIQDFSGALCEMTFAGGSLQLLDLDRDGILEVCFIYQNVCDGNDPYTTKLMLMHNGQKLAIRGKFSPEDNAEVEKTVDPAVSKYAPIFKNFMLMNWNEFKSSEIEYSKSIHYHTDQFIVLRKEYLMASGGTEYQLLDVNGLPLPLAKGLEDKVNYPVSLHMMPDQKTLLYAGLSGVGTYDPITKQENVFMTFFEDTEAVSSLSWSPDNKRVAFTALNASQYPSATRVFVLTLEGNTMAKKDKYDAKLMYMAASDWVVEAPRFKDNHTLEYIEKVIKDNEVMEGDLKTIVLE
jgi:hypothetical protein